MASASINTCRIQDQKLATKRTKIIHSECPGTSGGRWLLSLRRQRHEPRVTVDNMIRALDSNMPVVGGYSWLSCLDTSTFEQTGVMPAPFGKLEGGHCNDCVGADIPARMFLWHNTYGNPNTARSIRHPDRAALS
jgi:hypothetical protein